MCIASVVDALHIGSSK